MTLAELQEWQDEQDSIDREPWRSTPRCERCGRWTSDPIIERRLDGAPWYGENERVVCKGCALAGPQP